MRLLFTIAHYYNASGGGFYGSLKADPKPRQSALVTTVFGLHATFGGKQGLLTSGRVVPTNTASTAEIDVVICTTGEQHLVKGLGQIDGLFRHHATRAEPKYLGFECHDVLRSSLGTYDYYCYLEDDLQIADPLFLQKLEWFNRLAGDECVLQPNRFELALRQPWQKIYIDGNLAQPEISTRLQDINDRTALEGEALGAPVRLQRVMNAHSGCFFLNARQMAHWSAQPDFLVRDSAWAGPLESAATLGIVRHFRVYKPARENAGFLELRHLDNRYLGVRLRGKPAAKPA
jgi:hypothetical protein